ncbi:hypothetical protein [Metabacillus idriensis]|nr:hypothetical protein [Metabacillus idriensis]
MALVVICRNCSGAGKIRTNPFIPLSKKCLQCNGTGKYQEFTYKN